jgi:hypothetical protein
VPGGEIDRAVVEADRAAQVRVGYASVSSVLTLASAYQDRLSIAEQTEVTVPDTWSGPGT